MYETLRKYHFVDNPQSAIVNERAKLKTLQLDPSKLTMFLSDARSIYNKLHALGSPMSLHDYTITLIQHIPDHYNFIR